MKTITTKKLEKLLEQQFILKQMRMLQPCEISCEVEEEKKIPEKLEILPDNEHYSNKVFISKINEIIDYLKSKGE